MRPTSLSLSSATTSSVIPVDSYIPVSISVEYTTAGTATYSVEYTNDDIGVQGYNPATGTWSTFPEASGLTAGKSFTASFLCRAIRFKITSYTSGTVRLTATQNTDYQEINQAFLVNSLTSSTSNDLQVAVGRGARKGAGVIELRASGNDDTAALNEALAALVGSGGPGGGIFIPAGHCPIIAGQVVIPFAGIWNHAPLRIYGVIGDFTRNGSGLDLRYSSGPKIVTEGQGILEIDHLYLTDTTDGTQAFIYTKATKLQIHDIVVLGKNDATVGQTPQDFAIFGPTSGISGCYMSTLERIDASYIGRLAYLRYDANSINVLNCHARHGCGGTAFVESAGNPASATLGGRFVGNLIEGPDYVYGMKFANHKYAAIGPNDFYDAVVPGDQVALAVYRMESTATQNILVDQVRESAIPFVSDAGNTNWHISNFEDAATKLVSRSHHLIHSLQSELLVESTYSTTGRRWKVISDPDGALSIFDAGHNGSGGNGAVLKLDQNGDVTFPVLAGSGTVNLQVNSAGKISRA